MSGAEYALFPRTTLNLGIGRSLFGGYCELYLSQRWHSVADDVPASEGFPAHALPRFARTDLSLSRDFSRQLKGTLQLRNLFDRANLLPSPQASLGGIPDERFSVNLAVNYRF
jgi:outer membrane receptor protein involved in Fe transport